MAIEFSWIPNLSAQYVEFTEEPWNCGADRVPKLSKDRWTAWATRTLTKHCFISLNVSECLNVRLSAESPVSGMRGLIVDYDCYDLPWEDGELELPEKRLRILPNYYYRTKSGGIRLIWMFERSVAIGTRAFYGEFIKKIKGALNLAHVFPKLDENALNNPNIYYDIGADDWIAVEDEPAITEEYLVQFEMAAFKASRESWKSEGVVAPIAAVISNLKRKYPNTTINWDLFEVGYRCHRFWEEGADAQGTVVTPIGMHTFTGEGRTIPWGDEKLCGPAFILKYSEVSTASAVEGMWSIGTQHYEYSERSKRWVQRTEGQIRNALAVSFQLSSGVRKGQNHSEISEALRVIAEEHSAKGKFPYLFQKDRVVEYQGDRFLNTSVAKVLAPDPNPCQWGERFPRIAAFMEEAFQDDDLEYVISWLAHAYQCGYHYAPDLGLCLIIMGNPDTGKGFFSGAIICQLLGFGENAENYFVRGDQFNDNLMAAPVWRLDDPVNSPDNAKWQSKAGMTKLIKATVANNYATIRGMGQSGFTIPANMRIVMTCNLDRAALDAFPNVGPSVKDKLLVVKMNETKIFSLENGGFPTDEQLRRTELPHFASFLKNVEIADDLKGDRFGVKHYFNPELQKIISVENPEADRLEYLASCLEEAGGRVEGSATKIWDLLSDPTFKDVFRSPNYLGRCLASYATMDLDFLKVTVKIRRGTRMYLVETVEGDD